MPLRSESGYLAKVVFLNWWGTHWGDALSRDRSVSELLAATRQGDATAPDHLFDCYFPQLVSVAKGQLAGMASSATDEEDVALSVMNSFFDALLCDRFPQLQDPQSLARLLFRMTIRKATDYRRHEHRAKRGGNFRRQGNACHSSGDLELCFGPSGELGPDLVVMMQETLNEFLDRLADEALQALVMAKLAGYTNNEIAEQLDCSISTVERRLRLIRKIWECEGRE